MNIVKQLSIEFGVKEDYCENIVSLIAEGNTIPFIARYRKEMHGSCDDQLLREFADRLKYLENLEQRKKEVATSIEEQGKLSPEILISLQKAKTMTEVEDIYRPYKKKKKTRAMLALEAGLQPVADIIKNSDSNAELEKVATELISEKYPTLEKVIVGGQDILAEEVSDDADMRKILRGVLFENAFIKAKTVEGKDAGTYEMYADFSEKVSAIPSHRILAINRGENEGCLKVGIEVDENVLLAKLFAKHISKTCNGVKMEEAVRDSLSRLVLPSLERELRGDLTDSASEQAIKMFELNLKPLLMQPPLKNKVILGLDPAYRTGCKVAVINCNGDVLATDVVYPTPPQSKIEEATLKLTALINKHQVDVISIGNGTATKETEIFTVGLIKGLKRTVKYAVVNESGASVYSASKLGAEEFPQYDVSLRSAISIARRLQDPLAELIKIDVKSIGVGQYQHDMPQKRLSEVLQGVVENCVNSVGVDLNTASFSLLSYVSGLNASTAKNIVKYRSENNFRSRKDLLKVPKLGAKAFEQCAGFLRIAESKNVLDNTAVHPESYESAGKLLSVFGYELKDVAEGKLQSLTTQINTKGIAKVADEIGVGAPTLKDIADELQKPGRDVRDDLPEVELRADLLDIKNLKPGMELHGTARNIIDFGVFVDIGVHQDGLVHISQISDKYIKHPSEVLKVGDRVNVRVLEVDTKKNRISLTMLHDKKQTENKVKAPKIEQSRDQKPQDLDSMLEALKNRFK